jgi:N-acetylmuramoyl-L-alanine amidase
MQSPVARAATFAASSAVAILFLSGCGLGTSSKTKTTVKGGSTTTAKGGTTTVPKVTIPPATPTVFATIPVPPGTTTTTGVVPPGAPGGGQAPPGSIPKPNEKYIVKSGDTMGNIAAAMGVKLQLLLDANGMTIKDANGLQPGRQLTVPDGGFMPPGGPDAAGPPAVPPGQAPTPTTKVGQTTTAKGAPAGTTKYKVLAGEGWIPIANKFGITLDSLLKANGATTASVLQPGQQINVPNKTAANTASTVKPTATTKKPVVTTKPTGTTAAKTTTTTVKA